SLTRLMHHNPTTFHYTTLFRSIISAIGKKLKSDSTKAQEESAHFLSLVEETLSSLKIIKGFNAEKRFRKSFGDSVDRLNKILNRDRKSTRLNSSHVSISYAVFC